MTFIQDLEAQYQVTSDPQMQVALDEQHLAYLEKVLKEDPNNIEVLIHYGVLSWEPFHEYERGVESLKKVLQLDPKNVNAYFWLATVYYHDYCQYKLAEEAAVAGLKIDPTNADCLYRLAVIIEDYYEDIPRALQYAQQAADYAPHCPAYIHYLCRLLTKTRNVQAAEFYLEKFIKLSQKPPVKIRNGIEYYYEKIVTWRGRSDNPEQAKRLTDRVDAAKKGVPYQPFVWTPPASWLEEDKKLADAKKHNPKTH